MSENYPYCDFFGALAKVYTLADKNGNVFYVGCTIGKMEARFAQHIAAAKRDHKCGNYTKNALIRSLNYVVVATIIEMKWVTGQRGRDAARSTTGLEIEWIKKYRSLGYELCNRQDAQFKIKVDTKPEYVGQTFKSSLNSIQQNSVEEKAEEPAK